MKILILGKSGREHAYADTFFRQGHSVYCYPGNGGTHDLSQKIPPEIVPNNLQDVFEIATFAKKLAVDLTIVSSISYLNRGISEVFSAQKMAILAPTRHAIALEINKAYAKEFMTKYAIPTSSYKHCRSYSEAYNFLKSKFSQWNGVIISSVLYTKEQMTAYCKSFEEADKVIKKISDDGHEIIIEELLSGEIISLATFTDGKTFAFLPTCYEHGYLQNDSKGFFKYNLGAYAPAFNIKESDIVNIVKSFVDKTKIGLEDSGIVYKGILTFEILIKNSRPFLLNYYCRLGNPQAQTLLPLLKSDLAEILISCVEGKLESKKLQWHPRCSCCVVLAAAGYSEKSVHTIYGIDLLLKEKNIYVFFDGVKREATGRFTTSGERVLEITGYGTTLDEAIANAYRYIPNIEFLGCYYRKDIGHIPKEARFSKEMPRPTSIH